MLGLFKKQGMQGTLPCIPGEVHSFYYDLLQVPHLLIGGSTGSGKSVLARSLIYTAMHGTTDECKFIIIDPKRTDLKMFKDCPHVITRTTEIKDSLQALQKALDIMENRFIYTEKNDLDIYPGTDLYIVVEEFADIMIQAKRQVEPILFRLIQLGRSARIHVILATQRTTAKIIDGLIKVNIDNRIALHVPTKQDSRNIIECNGAETLPKIGYCYYMSPETDTPQLHKIPYIDKNTIKRDITRYLQ